MCGSHEKHATHTGGTFYSETETPLVTHKHKQINLNNIQRRQAPYHTGAQTHGHQAVKHLALHAFDRKHRYTKTTDTTHTAETNHTQVDGVGGWVAVAEHAVPRVCADAGKLKVSVVGVHLMNLLLSGCPQHLHPHQQRTLSNGVQHKQCRNGYYDTCFKQPLLVFFLALVPVNDVIISTPAGLVGTYVTRYVDTCVAYNIVLICTL